MHGMRIIETSGEHNEFQRKRVDTSNRPGAKKKGRRVATATGGWHGGGGPERGLWDVSLKIAG